MAKSWQEVAATPQFQALTSEQKQQAQEQYFSQVVAPQAGEQAEAARAQFFNTYSYTQEKVEPSFFEKVTDLFTGESRETRATEELPELAGQTGLLAGEDPAKVAAFSAGFLTTTDDQEAANMLQSLFPGTIGIQYDEKGNIIAANNKTGQRVVINKPGVSKTDIAQALGIAAAFAPTTGGVAGGLAKKAGAQALKAGTVSAGIEAGQEQIGGEFDVSNVALDMITAGAGEAIPAYFRHLVDKRARQAEEATAEAAAAEAARIGSPLSPEMAAQQQRGAVETVGQQARSGVRKDLEQVAAETSPDPQIIAAAERLGVADALTPGQVSRSQAYRELEGGIAAMPATAVSQQRKAAISRVAQQADDLIIAHGGVIDKAALSERLKGTILQNIDDLDKEASRLYRDIDAIVPKGDIVDATGIADALLNEAAMLKGVENLEPIQKRLLKIASNNPTYALLDKERRKIGAAIGKLQGPYKDADSYTLGKLYDAVTKAQEAHITDIDGAGELWKTAKGLVSQRKRLEEESIQLLGKDLAGAIMPKVGASLKKLSAGDYRDFDRIIKALHKDQRETAVVSALNDVFTLGSRAEKQLSAPGFVDWFEQLKRQPAVMDRVKNNLPAGAFDRMKDLYQVAKGIRLAGKEEIRTGVVMSLLDNFNAPTGLVEKMYTGARDFVAKSPSNLGAIARGLQKLKSDPITKSADDLLSSKEFKEAIAAYADDSVAARAKQFKADRALARSERYNKWLERMPDEIKQKVANVGLIAWLGESEAEPKPNQ